MEGSKLYVGSICLDDLMAQARVPHSAFNRSTKNNKAYVNIKVWINEKENQYKQHGSVQLNSAKDHPDGKVNIYLGNLKLISSEGGAPQPFTQADANAVSGPLDDLPF